MNLLTIVHYPVFSGPHNRVLRMSPLLKQNGWQSFLVIPDEEGNAAERLREADCEVIPITLHRFRNKLHPRWAIEFIAHFRGDIERIRKIIRSRKIDLVLIGGFVNPQGAIAGRLEGIPVVWQIIDSRNSALLRRLMMPLVLRLADALMFGGQALVDLHLGKRSIKIPVAVCPPPVDTTRFVPSEPTRHNTRKALGIPPNAQVVGMVANLNPQKGIEYFVRAASIIAETTPGTFFLVVGATYETHARYTALIETEINNSGIPPDQFLFAGGRADVEHFYPAMDVKLISSVPRSEGTTTTSMEAMACGVPVVATDVGAVKEVVLDGETGFIVPPLDSEALAEATLRLLKDDELAARMGGHGRRRAVSMFDSAVSLERYLEILQNAMDHYSSRRATRHN